MQFHQLRRDTPNRKRMTVARGGKREGSGRKVGSLTKRTQEVAERAIAEGKSPLEVMLDNMRHFQQVAFDAEAVLAGLTAEEYSGVEMTPENQFKKLLAEVKKGKSLGAASLLSLRAEK